MSLGIQKFNSKQNIFERTSRLHRTEIEVDEKKKRSLLELRYKRDKEVSSKDKITALTGAAIGTLIPMLISSKVQKKSIFKMKYRFTEMASMAFGANAFAVTANSIGKNYEEKKKKVNEGIFQVLNAVLPMSFVDGSLKLCSKFKKTNNAPAKIASSALGVLAGTQLGIRLANKITDPKNVIPDRKYTAKDSLANLDDAVSILVLGKVPFANKIHIEKALPFIYGYSGYRSGTSN